MAAQVGVTGHLCQAWDGVEEAPYTQGVGVEELVEELAEQTVLGRVKKHFAGKVTRSLGTAAASWKGWMLEKGSGLHWGSPLPSPYQLEYICSPFEQIFWMLLCGDSGTACLIAGPL